MNTNELWYPTYNLEPKDVLGTSGKYLKILKTANQNERSSDATRGYKWVFSVYNTARVMS